MHSLIMLLTISGLFTGATGMKQHMLRAVNPAVLNQARSSGQIILPRVQPLKATTQGMEVTGFSTAVTPSVVSITNGAFTTESGVAAVFGPVVNQALDVVPDWLRSDLAMQFSHMDAGVRQKWAQVIVDSKPDYRDETGFMVAHTGLEELSKPDFDIHAITDQAEFIYAQADKLGWATLIEHGDSATGGDFWTTVKLHYTKDGNAVDYEVPKDKYYWFVVHAREDAEKVQTTEPDTGLNKAPPTGRSWREYFTTSVTDTKEYTDHMLFRTINDIPNGPMAANIQAMASFKPLDRAAVDLIYGPDKELVMFETRWGKGSILATTLPVEKLYTDKTSPLLQNMMMYGNGNCYDHSSDSHLILTQRTEADEPVAKLFKDRHGKYTLMSPADFAAADLDKYDRIIVTGGGTKVLYQAVADRRKDVEDWVGKGHKLDMILAASDDLDGLTFPANVAVKTSAKAITPLHTHGWPAFWEVVPNTDSLWDGEKHNGISGSRAFDPGTFALDKLGWFIGVNMPDDIHKYFLKSGIQPARFVQAVSVLYHHVGNCGELEDIVTATLRSGLIPTANSMDSAEDHVWSEFYVGDAWHPFQLGWDQGDTAIDNYAISMEKKFGGGKDISTIVSMYGDGRVLNRTPAYTDTFTLDLNVTDNDGTPIDGAWVMLASEGYYKDPNTGKYPLYPVYFALTGADGRLKVKLGDNQNFYVVVKSDLGRIPEQDNTVTLVAEDKDAVPGAVIKRDIKIKGALKRASFQSKVSSDADCRLNVRLLKPFYWNNSPFTGTSFMKDADATPVTVAVLDQAGLQSLKDGKSDISTLAAVKNVTDSAEIGLDPSWTEPIFLVVYPNKGIEKGVLYTAAIECKAQADEGKSEPAMPDIVAPDTGSDAGSDLIKDASVPADNLVSESEPQKSGGCDTKTGTSPLITAIFGLTILVLGLFRRKRA